jgi:hypothetical protein
MNARDSYPFDLLDMACAGNLPATITMLFPKRKKRIGLFY